MTEYIAEIVAAAIRDESGNVLFLPKPARHHDVIRVMVDAGYGKPIRGEQGFIDAAGQFLGREDALARALALGQVESGKTHSRRILFSEDLW